MSEPIELGEPDVIRNEDNILWLRAEIERLRAGCDRLHGYIAEKDAEIERLKRMRDMWKATANSNRDEIERLQETAQVMWDEWTYLKARNEKLEKVLEHAKHLLAGGDEESVHHLNKAIAAADERDDE